MKIFTDYENKNSQEKMKAVYWDGNYEVYRQLVKFDPDFVAVLDDSGQKGKDSIKIWNSEIGNWEVCNQGNYLVKNNKNSFTVKSREEIISKFRRDA